MEFRIFFIGLVLFSSQCMAQEVKFGKVSKEELLEEFHTGDPDAPAAYLNREETVYYRYSLKNGFELVRDLVERIKIYNKDGLEYAVKEVSLYKTDKGKENITGIKGNTYNLENGKINKTSLGKDGIFREEVSEFRHKVKIAMPNVNAGSVIEFKYQMISPFIFKIDEIPIQMDIPTNRVYAKLRIPEYFKNKPTVKGYYPIDIKNSKQFRSGSYDGRMWQKTWDNEVVQGNQNYGQKTLEYYEIESEVNMTNVPAFKSEAYISNPDNYKAALNIEIVSLSVPGVIHETYSRSWADVARVIYQSGSFGMELNKNNYFEDDLEVALAGTSDKIESMYRAFNFVKQKVRWNNNYGVLCQEGVKDAYKDHSGNSGDINLMLISVLRKAGLEAYPVLVSTRDHGIPLFPTLNGYNYVVAAAKIDDHYYLMDATETYSLPNVLPFRSLNWIGRMIDNNGNSRVMNLMPSKPSVEAIIMNVKLNENGTIEGSCREQLNRHKALQFRNLYNSKSEETFIEELEQEKGDMVISNYQLKNNLELHKPVVQSFDFEVEDAFEIIDNKIYFSPFFHLGDKENPFKSEKRKYPIDYGYPIQYKYLINIQIPDGYQIESVPEPTAISMPDSQGIFKYNIAHKGNMINVKASMDINAAIIAPQQYGFLKEFYAKLIEKETEKVVLSKITGDGITERTAGGR